MNFSIQRWQKAAPSRFGWQSEIISARLTVAAARRKSWRGQMLQGLFLSFLCAVLRAFILKGQL
jgi:hypothetical protein